MRNIFFTLLFLVSSIIEPGLRSQTNTDSLINSIISRVNTDSVSYNIQLMQDFQSRYMLAGNRFLVADWLVQRFESFGFTNIERDSFMCTSNFGGTTTTLQVNVIATVEGTSRPEEVYIIGGHYDSYAYGNPFNDAPGADDNASGTTAVLEFARIMMESGYQPEATMKFIAFGAEELMLFGDSGCEHYAQKAYNDGMNIKLMINCDMISHNTLPIEQAKVRINYYTGFFDLLDIAKSATNQFSLITGINGSLNQYSDSYPFYEKGFPAVYFEESQFSPYYHTIDDRIENYNMEYCGEVIKSAGATLLKHMFMNSPTSLPAGESVINNFVLSQNYPNPFNPVTKISWQVPESGWQSLKVYDCLGIEIATLVDEFKSAGRYEVSFDASQLSSGVYFYSLTLGDFVSTRKMVLIK